MLTKQTVVTERSSALDCPIGDTLGSGRGRAPPGPADELGAPRRNRAGQRLGLVDLGEGEESHPHPERG